MISTLAGEFAAHPPKEFGALLSLLEAVTDDARYRGLVATTLGAMPNYQERKALLDIGMFSEQDFLQLLHASGAGDGMSMNVVMPFLNRLTEWALVSDNGFFGPYALVRFRWAKERISGFLKLRVLDNALLGPSYVAQKYRSSVPAIFVTKGGDQFTGTGFLACTRVGGKPVIVTAKHNVDTGDGVTFDGFNEPEGIVYTPGGSWVLHPKLDLALMSVEYSGEPVPIYPVGTPAVLARTITLGYPRIATTDAPYLLAHGGELNAVVKNYHGEAQLVISNVVAPGNSGGPVLDVAGTCVGLVVRSLETEHLGGMNKTNAAIPAVEIAKFIDPYCA